MHYNVHYYYFYNALYIKALSKELVNYISVLMDGWMDCNKKLQNTEKYTEKV